jgi:hypothetical protein
LSGGKVEWCFYENQVNGNQQTPEPTNHSHYHLSCSKYKNKWLVGKLRSQDSRSIRCTKGKHAFRKGHSCDDAFTGTVNTIEHAMHNGQFAVTVFLDIRGAFDNITSDAIILAMERHHINPEIAGWYELYLINRL